MTLANAPLKGRDNDGYGSDLGPLASEISGNRKLIIPDICHTGYLLGYRVWKTLCQSSFETPAFVRASLPRA